MGLFGFATLTWVDNGSRMHESLGYLPPALFEQAFHNRHTAPPEMTLLT